MIKINIKNLKITKHNVLIIITIISLMLNLIQYSRISKINRQKKLNDCNFNYCIQGICYDLEDLKTGKRDRVSTISTLSSDLGIATTLYPMTSYYNNNIELYYALDKFHQGLTNTNALNEILNQNDLTVLLPYLKKIRDNPSDTDPLDDKETKEFRYLIRKVTSLGWSLP